MPGTSDAWLMSRSSHQPSEPAYYIEDSRISRLGKLGGQGAICLLSMVHGTLSNFFRNSTFFVLSR